MSDTQTKGKSYRDTLNLPQTSFAMKANLTQREPQQRKAWDNAKIYQRIQAARAGKPPYILHDGPPYANGDIHMGHVINKVLKDFVVKYKTMAGFQAPYVPGWDCHGLPIEVKVMAELGNRAQTMDKIAIRRECHKYALKYVKLQTNQFKSLGVFGDFENPYLTLDPSYEQGILEIFAELVGNGLVYKQLKPIHWSVGCQTALADAELEYQDIESPSIYVNFPLTEQASQQARQMGLAPADAEVSLMIWTTTPWTLAANLAVAVHPHLKYVGLTYSRNGKKMTSIVAKTRLEAVCHLLGLDESHSTVSTPVMGSDLEYWRYRHPFLSVNPTEKDAWFVILADFVSTEDGTGLVHIAPGHGTEDYQAGMRYGLAVYSPVRDDGCYDATVPDWLQGQNVLKVDSIVNQRLAQSGLLVYEGKMLHSYPHCWRSKMPVIFRATEQWFISVDRPIEKFGKSLRQLALEQIQNVQWVPAWGQKRIEGMLQSRPDWCISRQRAWGLPIPSFMNSKGQVLLTKESVLAVAKTIGKKGSDCWFTDTPRQLLGEDFVLPEGFSWDDLHKEQNIFDVWFESGCSWHSVIAKSGQPIPVDLYLEGSDQHRGWFQLSLLPALGSIGKAPFRTVLTHGFTVDEKGMKQSKSAGNYVSALEEIEKYGADILRLWVASVNYQEDMRCSDELIGRLQDAYRKIRNTLRYLLSNINDFDPATMAVPYQQMHKIDRWAMDRLNELIGEVRQAYDEFLFHRVYTLLYNFCAVTMSSIYMDVLKDRMYCEAPDSWQRRSGQTAMYRILDALVLMLAPLLAHTAEEAWAAIPHKSQPVDSVHLAVMPTPDPAIDPQKDLPYWNILMDLRDNVLKKLEDLRKNEMIGSNQEALVAMGIFDKSTLAALDWLGVENFAALCIVSVVEIEKADHFYIRPEKCRHPKCPRCWNYLPTVGKDSRYPDLCARCAQVVAAMST